MEEVIRRERDKIAAKGRAYAARPSTFQDSLVSPGVRGWHISDGDVGRKSRGNQEGGPKVVDRRGVDESKPAAAPIAQKTAADLASLCRANSRMAAGLWPTARSGRPITTNA